MPKSKSQSKPKTESSRGVLKRSKTAEYFTVARYNPPGGFAWFVEHFWIVRWDLRGKDSHTQDVLSHPSVHLVFEKGSTRIWGVVTGKFTRVIEEKGQVLGIKFKPGGFYPFIQKPVALFSDQRLPFEEVFDEDLESLEEKILGCEEDQKILAEGEAFLNRHLPVYDPRVEEVSSITAAIMDDPTILKVDDLVNRCDMSKRTLQRLFRKYVGVSPKWVIQRYRLHEAAEKMASGENRNWSQLALELGYYDQSHFIRDFKSIVGQSPADYAESLNDG